MASSGHRVEQSLVDAIPDPIDSLYALNRVSQWDVSFTQSGQYATAYALRRGAKPFIIGLIPPDVEVNFVPVERDQTKLSDVTSGTSANPVDKKGDYTPDKLAIAYNPQSAAFYKKFYAVCQSIGCSPEDLLAVLLCESALDPNSHGWGANKHVEDQTIARGLNQLVLSTAKSLGMTEEFWRNQYSNLSAEDQLPWVEKYFKSNYSRPYANAGQMYVVNFAPALVDKAADPNSVLYSAPSKEYEHNAGADKAEGGGKKGFITAGDMGRSAEGAKLSYAYKKHMEVMEAAIGKEAAHSRPKVVQPGFATSTTDGSVKDQGEPARTLGGVMMNGNVTSPEEDDPIGGRTGRNIRVSDKRLDVVMKQVKELQRQIEAARAVPGLLMLVNPSEFNRSYEATVDAPKTRSGHVVHMWLEKPASISCKGVTAAQFAIEPGGGGGVTHSNRVHSASYRNLMSLVALYRNNGSLFTGNMSEDASKNGVGTLQMSVYVYYDGHIYLGSFDDLSVTDDADKPFNLSYSWKFNVRYDFEVSAVTDDLIERVLSVGGSAPFTPVYPGSATAKDGFAVVSNPDGTTMPFPPKDGAPVPDGTQVTTSGGITYYNRLTGVPSPGGAK